MMLLIFGTISSSSFSSNTTVNVTWDSGTLSSETLVIYIAALSVTGSSIPPNVLIPADNSITSAKILNGAVGSDDLATNAVTTIKITDANVTTAKITDLNVTTAKIAADAINATKLADDAISEEHLDTTAIIGHTELAEVAASGDIFLVYDTSAGALKKILSSNVGITPPTFTSVSPSNVLTGDGTGNATIVITGTNFDAQVTARLKTTAGVDVNFSTVTRNSGTQITGVIC